MPKGKGRRGGDTGSSRGDGNTGSFRGGRGRGEYQGGRGRGEYQGGRGRGEYQGGRGRGEYQGGRGRGEYQGGRGGGQGPRIVPTSTAKIFLHTAADTAKVDPQAQTIENALQISYKQNSKKADLDLRRPHRPGYGTLGKSVILWANYFELTPTRNLVLQRYSVVIEKDEKGKTPKGAKAKRLIQLLLEDHFAESINSITTDYQANLVCTSELAIGEQPITVQYRAENKDLDGSEQTYRLQVQHTGVLSIAELMDYLTSTNVSTRYDKDETIQALNIMLGHYPKTNLSITSVGANKHFPLGQEVYNLSSGLDAVRGYFVSVRAAASRLLINVQVKNLACFQAGILSNVASQMPYGSRLAFMKGLRVKVTHLSKKNKAGQEVPRIKIIHGFATPQDGQGLPHPPKVLKFAAGPKDVEFWLEGEKGKQSSGKSRAAPGRYISVYDYFFQFIPVVNVRDRKDPSYVPMEYCEIVPGQPSKGKLDPKQTAAMIAFAVRPPVANAQSIVTKGPSVLGLSTLEKLGISVVPRLIAVPGRVLSAPAIRYKNKVTMVPRDASWNMRQIQFTAGARVPAWAWINFEKNNVAKQWTGRDGTQVTLDEFRGVLNASGLDCPRWVMGDTYTLPKPTSRIETPRDTEENLQFIDGIFGGFATSQFRPRLILVILADNQAAAYKRIKYLGDIKYGIHTVCAIAEKFRGRHPGANAPYFANVALKFNLKLGGVNQALDPDKLRLIKDGKTMVVGLDVTHPSPGSLTTAPSVAGIVASVDAKLGQWPAEVRIQKSRQEEISNLDQLLKRRLVVWREKNNKLPENILVYRDGVSEGQYNIVVENELPQLRKACSGLYQKNKEPRFSIIIVGKRHHTRFYGTKVDDVDGRSCNPKNGTVVDRGVTEPRNWDFFLQAHSAQLGTARPAHYFVVLDEIFRKQPVQPPHQSAADALEDLTHNMCYLFGRATKAVSVCPPAYYADLVCERARCYLSRFFDKTPELTPASSVTGDAHEPQADPSDVVIHPSIKDTMFYL
ncbi:MAG: hypothetical protein M1834_002448 [Cirrosporium novae-zelandiae]|nr:MAG: hypothetical protein M1834_002448 [Cirrosporium novae-zelandiae]